MANEFISLNCGASGSLWKETELEKDLRPDFSPNLSLPRHRWFPFKEGFSSSLVSYLLLHRMPRFPGKLFDPFLGSGTSALEAAWWGWESWGVEVNPFMAFVSKVKTERDYNPSILHEAFESTLSSRPRHVYFKIPRETTMVERNGLDRWLFNYNVAVRFEEIRSAIEESNTELKYRKLLLLALIRAMQDVANAKRDGKCWRYKREWQNLNYQKRDLEQYFMRHIDDYIEDLHLIRHLPGKAHVHIGDSRSLIDIRGFPKNKRFDMVITSPPYLNSFDYTDIYRPEMLLLGPFRNSGDLRKVRYQTLRSHVQVDWPKPTECNFKKVRQISEALRKVRLWDKRLPEMVEAYFIDLNSVIKACVERVKPGALICFVVCNSAYSGVVIPVDEILEDIYRSNGISIIEQKVLRESPGNGYHQRKSREKLREVLLIGRLEP